MPVRCYGLGCKDASCHRCRSGRWSGYQWGYLPRDCCLLNARRVRKDELDTYRLFGPVEHWWICPECKRCFGVQPELMGVCVDDVPAP